MNKANSAPWNSLPVFVLVGFVELFGRPAEEVVVRHLDHLVEEGVYECCANEAGLLRRCPDRALQGETLDGEEVTPFTIQLHFSDIT